MLRRSYTISGWDYGVEGRAMVNGLVDMLEIFKLSVGSHCGPEATVDKLQSTKAVWEA